MRRIRSPCCARHKWPCDSRAAEQRDELATADHSMTSSAMASTDGTSLHVINLHLRAPLAGPVAGQKLGPFSWRTVGGWAEGFFLAGVKRSGQALEARLLTEQLLDADPGALVVVAGDLNADVYEVPLRILRAELGDVGNAAVSSRGLFPVENVIPEAQRFTVLHCGRRLMLDHLLVSAMLRAYLTSAESLNQGLADEADSAEQGSVGGSFHAPLVAEFVLPVGQEPRPAGQIEARKSRRRYSECMQ
jgi:hypothetical protein